MAISRCRLPASSSVSPQPRSMPRESPTSRTGRAGALVLGAGLTVLGAGPLVVVADALVVGAGTTNRPPSMIAARELMVLPAVDRPEGHGEQVIACLNEKPQKGLRGALPRGNLFMEALTTVYRPAT